ncbi:myelin regulatory factor-like protein [Tubulanus polymorphus]|uniref:myelin regulatory factor-like protein n=1 Tax=Tubulanus polymorphus TaxID=672921 RepID=UPI003DA432A8
MMDLADDEAALRAVFDEHGIDNEALDFLDSCIPDTSNDFFSANDEVVAAITAQVSATPSVQSIPIRNRDPRVELHAKLVASMPETPPDSGSEAAFSPARTSNGGHTTSNQIELQQTNGASIGQPYILDNRQKLPAKSSSSPDGGRQNYVRNSPAAAAATAGAPQLFHTTTIPSTGSQMTSFISPTNKKRRFDESNRYETYTVSDDGLFVTNNINIKPEPTCTPIPQAPPAEEFGCCDDSGGKIQFIHWKSYQSSNWATLLDSNLSIISTPVFRVIADKGFNLSTNGDAFVCQKKNHFQITVHTNVTSTPRFLQAPNGNTFNIVGFYVHFYGIKMETPNQAIRIEQSQPDRTKKPFHPVKIDLLANTIAKLTVGRLHFSETTLNNMRKKGKPNPDQRYFMLVVALHAHTSDGNSFMTVAAVSDKIIVRASNPGQFEPEVDTGSWQRGLSPGTVHHMGHVGIKTDNPQAALDVHGNVLVTGHVVQPSDKRAKKHITELDSKEQLKNVSQLKVYQYEFRSDFAKEAGLAEDDLRHTGVLAQEVQDIIPDAVTDKGDVTLANGETIETFLVVNKDRIYMENVGAVKELCKLTDNLENRIDELERVNRRLTRIKNRGGARDSFKSTSSKSTEYSDTNHSRQGSTRPPLRYSSHHRCSNHHQPRYNKQFDEAVTPSQGHCSNRVIQLVIVVLVLVMAFCLIAITTLYILEKQVHDSHDETVDVGQTSLLHRSTTALLSMTTISTLPSSTPSSPGVFTTPNIVSSSFAPVLTTVLKPPSTTLLPTNLPSTSQLIPTECLVKKCLEPYCCTAKTYNLPPAPSKPLHKKDVFGDSRDNKTKSDAAAGHLSSLPDTADIHSVFLSNDDSNSIISDAAGSDTDTDDKDMKPSVNKDDLNGDDSSSRATSSSQSGSVLIRKKRMPKQANNCMTLDNKTIAATQPPMNSDEAPAGDKPVNSIAILCYGRFQIDSRFCVETSCKDETTRNFTYKIPVSHHLPIISVPVIFWSDRTVHFCSHVSSDICRSDNQAAAPVESVPETWGVKGWLLPVGYYFSSSYRFRVTRHDVTDPCALPDDDVRFVEYNIEFQRSCPNVDTS